MFIIWSQKSGWYLAGENGLFIFLDVSVVQCKLQWNMRMGSSYNRVSIVLDQWLLLNVAQTISKKD